MKKFKKINYSLLVFLMYSSKLVALGAGYPDAIIVLGLAALYGYSMFLSSREPDQIQYDRALKTELDNIKANVNALKLEKSIKKPIKW